MNFKRLEISKEYDYAKNAHYYKGILRVSSKSADISLNVDEALCNEILKICADKLVDIAKTIATDLTAECIEINIKKIKTTEGAIIL